MFKKSNTTQKTKKIFLSLLLICFLAVGVFGIAVAVKAETFIEKMRKSNFNLNPIADQLGLSKDDPRNLAIDIIRVILGFTSLLALVMIIYGGVVWLTSSGTPEKVSKGRNIIIWAAIGLIILLSSWTILSYIISAFGPGGTVEVDTSDADFVDIPNSDAY